MKRPSESETESQAKRAKTTGGCDLESLKSLEDFEIEEQLNYKPGEFAFFLARHKETKAKAVVKIRRSMPSADDLKSEPGKISLVAKGVNKAWGSFQGDFPSPSLNVDMYFPRILEKEEAEEAKLIDWQANRLRRKERFLVQETAEAYASHTQKFIEGIPDSAIGWCHNIVEHIDKEGKKQCYDMVHGKTKEKVLYSDPDQETGFALLVDFKWKKHPKTMFELMELEKAKRPTNGLYCIAFANAGKTLKSLRDLRAAHLPLLKNIRDSGLAKIQEVYGIERKRVRMFVHYLPQFYFFHVHFTTLDIDFGINVGRARLLDEIIANLELDGEYYAKALLSFEVFKDHELEKALLGVSA